MRDFSCFLVMYEFNHYGAIVRVVLDHVFVSVESASDELNTGAIIK